MGLLFVQSLASIATNLYMVLPQVQFPSVAHTHVRPLSDKRKGAHCILPKQIEINKFFNIGFNWARFNKFLQNLHSVTLSESLFSSSVQCDVLFP